MKKTVFTVIFLFTFFFIFPNPSNAQNFYCTWSNYGGGVCNVNTFTEECTANGCSYYGATTCNTLSTQIECGYAVYSCNCGTTGSSGINWNTLYSALGQSGAIFSFSQNLTIGPIINAILVYLFPLAGLLLLLYLIWGGFTYLTSAGNPQKMKQAQGVITNALVGFIIIFAAYWLATALSRILGITRLYTIFNP